MVKYKISSKIVSLIMIGAYENSTHMNISYQEFYILRISHNLHTKKALWMV